MLGFVDETFRDGPQSLWATRMKTASMLGAAQWSNQAGFRKVCVTSGAAVETAVRFLHDDPWERIRLLRRFMPDATIDVLVRSRNLFGWARYPDEVIELLFHALRRAGVQSLKVFDGLNDIDNIAACFRIGKGLGFQMSGMLTFSLSPAHTDEYFAGKARQLVDCGVDSITMGDASGLMTGARTKTLLAALKIAIGGTVPIEFLAHHTMGLAHESYREAMLAGVDTVATASAPLANGESLPSTLDVLEIADDLGIESNLDIDTVRRIDDYFHWIAYKEGRSIEEPVVYDPLRYEAFAGHQIPGGMMSNFRNQLREVGLMHRIDEVLEEASRVRAELGYPVMVTPFSQFVGVQATFNVIQGERYKTIPKELYLYALGHYGKPAAPIDPDVLDRVLKGKADKPIDASEVFGALILDTFRREQGPFRSDEELLLALFYGKEAVAALARERSRFVQRPTIGQPLQVLIEELARERGLRSIAFEKGPVKLHFSYA